MPNTHCHSLPFWTSSIVQNF